VNTEPQLTAWEANVYELQEPCRITVACWIKNLILYLKHSQEKETCLLVKGTKNNTTTIIRTGLLQKKISDVTIFLRNLTYPFARDIKKHLLLVVRPQLAASSLCQDIAYMRYT